MPSNERSIKIPRRTITSSDLEDFVTHTARFMRESRTHLGSNKFLQCVGRDVTVYTRFGPVSVSIREYQE